MTKPPEPAKPDPTASDPTASDPTASDPAAPDPAAPDPTAPDTAVPDPAVPDPTVPDPTVPDPTVPDPATPASPDSATSATPVLELRDVVIHYGRIRALHGISLQVGAGELVTLLGANGAGKSTTMRGISGLNRLTSGEILFNGEAISGLAPHERVKRGIIQVPEGRRIFPGMTVLENLDMGCYGRKFDSKAAYQESVDHVFELFPRLGERRKQFGGTMSGGEQQMLAIGRALMARPKLLLLDEPSMGLAPMVIQQIFRIIAQINAEGTTILLVEQNAQQALSRSTRGYILETGVITKEGAGRDLLVDDAVREAYLGVA